MNIPLVSEYKIPFILQRIIQTFFGGLNTETNGLPVKLAIFLLAPVVGITTSCLIDNHQIDSYIAVLVTALFGFFFTLLIQVLSMVQLYQVSALVLPDGSVKKSSVINRLLPVARFHSKTLIILTCVLSSSLMGIITHVFKIEHIQAHVHGNHLLALCVFLLVWFTTAIAHHSLTLGPPPETASYLMTFSKINSLNRPLHLLSLPVIVILFPSGFLPCTLLICCLPFLWLLGIVPPVSALLYYLLEQANMILFAGSCSSDFLALLISVTASSLVFVACHWTLHGWKFLLATSLATFLLSNKWISNWSQLKSIPFAMKTVVCVGGIVGISWIPDSWESLPLVFALVGLVGFTSVVHYSQQVYIGNQVKNPASALMDIRTPIINLTVNTARIVLHIGIPLTCLALIHGQLSHSIDLVAHILAFRLHRQLWQQPGRVALLSLILRFSDSVHSLLGDLPIEQQYFILHWLIFVIENFAHKLYLVVTILFSSVFIKKQRLAYSWSLFALNVILLPVNLLLILTSCVLNAPILPLFTLPVYLLSFPRPLKFWSTTPMEIAHSSSDSIYYKQIFPRLIESLHRQRLLWDFCSGGDFLLGRFDDRLMWFQVLESGHNYTVVQMKGLELQETSCHTIEASAIDQLIESAFGGNLDANLLSRFLNTNIHYTVGPKTKISVKTYSDAKNILTGIIDSPETFIRIKAIYCQVFIWLLLQANIEAKIGSFSGCKNDDVEMGGNDYERLQPKHEWCDASYQYSKSKSINQIVNYLIYTVEWMQDVMRVFRTKNVANLNETELQSLTITYRLITNVCFSIVFPATDLANAQFICDTFNGDLAKDSIDKKFFESNPDLYKICVKSFQYSTKIAFDRIIFASDELSGEELIDTLKDFDRNWFFGNRNQQEWRQSVIEEKEHLFSIAKDTVKENYTGHLLTLKEAEVYICSLNRAIIEAIWSSLSLELFYLTNDDEERYSIQAHSIILRNLTVQAADPPLGYPVFASKPVIVNHLI